MTPADAARPPVDLRRHRVAALVAAAVITLSAVAAVATFGLVPYPEVVPLADAPLPGLDGELAVLRWQDEPCLAVVDPDGVERTIRCGTAVEGFGLQWLDAATLVLRGGRVADQVTLVDVPSGELRVEAVAEDRLPASEGGDPVRTDRFGAILPGSDDGTVTVEVQADDGSLRTLLHLTGPESYSVFDGRWTADGGHVVLRDSAGRVLVVPATGGDPRLWATDVGEWAIP